MSSSTLRLFEVRYIKRSALVVARNHQHAHALVKADEKFWRRKLPVPCTVRRLYAHDVRGHCIEDDGDVWTAYRAWRRRAEGTVLSPFSVPPR